MLKKREVTTIKFLCSADSMQLKLKEMKLNREAIKVIAIGAAAVAVLSGMLLLVLHHNDQILSIQEKIRANNIQFKKMASQLESRTKRNAVRMDRWIETEQRKIAKRSANNSDGQPPGPLAVRGVVYTRWGRLDCPGKSKLIYNGLAADTQQAYAGGGGEYLCLHMNYTYQDNHFVESFQGASYIYGVEWRDSAWMNDLFDLQDTRGDSLIGHNLPCALCIAGMKHAQIMIPGQYECPQGWTYEYGGYIMAAGHTNKHSAEYICVDHRPQVVPGTLKSGTSSYLHLVETQCSSLTCEPVVTGREINCVVCTLY